MSEEISVKPNRRNVLKASVGAVGFGVPAAKADPSGWASGQTQLKGIVYDPITGEYLDDASGKLRKNKATLAGTLRVGGTRIPIQSSRNSMMRVDQGFVEESHRIRKGGEFAANGRPMRLKLTATGNNVSGILVPPGDGAEDQSVGFMLVPEGDMSREELAEGTEL